MLPGLVEKRFWFPLGIEPVLDGGFLREPENKRSHWIGNSEATTLQALEKVPCAILLGEPGIGKSKALELEKERLLQTIPRNRIQLLTLGQYITDVSLENAFSNTEIIDWQHSTENFYLLLDSLDEGRLRIETIAQILGNHLKNWPIDRLTLRITCRSADWPPNLEQTIKTLWGKPVNPTQKQSESESCPDSTVFEKACWGIWEIAPLRRADVEVLAGYKSIEKPEEFLAAVDQSHAGAFAAKPLTLEFLLGQYQTHKRLPERRVELYEKGCLELCKELSLDRKARGNEAIGSLSAKERLAVATRLAAVSILGNRVGFTEDEHVALENNLFFYEQAYGGEESTTILFSQSASTTASIIIDEKAIVETLSYGLFSLRGEGQFKWRHQTFAEFLAARYLVTRITSVERILNTLRLNGKVVPQLRSVAVFAAELHAELAATLRREEPELILLGDLRTATDTEKREITTALLEALDKRQLTWSDIYAKCKSLNHAELAEQLITFLFDESRPVEIREAAMPLADACDWELISQLLFKLAFDNARPPSLRADAVKAIATRGSLEEKSKLLPFAKQLLPRGDDLNQHSHVKDAKSKSQVLRAIEDMKGYALRALWPGLLSAEELFPLIEPPDHQQGSSDYAHFLSRDVMPHLKGADLPLALHWVKLQRDEQGQLAREGNYFIGRLCSDILWHAWDEWEDEKTIVAFTEVLADRMQHYRPFMDKRRDSWKDWVYDGDIHDPSDGLTWSQQIRVDERRRHHLLDALIDLSPFSEKPIHFSYDALPIAADVPFLLERFSALETIADIPLGRLRFLVQLINIAYGRERKQSDIDLIFAAWEVRDEKYSETRSPLQEQFDQYFKAIELDSEFAEILKTNWMRWQPHREAKKNKSAEVKETASQLIQRQLGQSETGEVGIWWCIAHNLFIEESRHANRSIGPADITLSPNWLSADETTKQRLLDAAWRYLNEYKPQPIAKLSHRLPYPEWEAGYRALALWYEFDRSKIESLDRQIWGRWIPAIVTFHDNLSSVDNFGFQRRLRQRHLFFLARKALPQATLDFFSRWLDAEIQGQWTIDSLDLIEEVPAYYEKFVELRQVYESQGLGFLMQAQWKPDDELCNLLISKLNHKKLTPAHFEELILPLMQRGVSTAIQHAKDLINGPKRGKRRQRAKVAATLLMSETRDGSYKEVWPALIKGQGKFGREVVSLLAYKEHHSDRYVPCWNIEQIADFYLWFREKFPKRGDPHFDGWHNGDGREKIARFRDRQVDHLAKSKSVEGIEQLKRLVSAYPNDEDLHRLLHWMEEEYRRLEWQPLTPQEIINLRRDPMQNKPSNESDKRFAVALSFPGERRAFVEQVANVLIGALGKERVLYDKNFEAEFARPNLDVHLPKLYLQESELIAVFLCQEYEKKGWCNLEWRFVRQMISTTDEHRIMFLNFDDTGPIPELGILAGDGYISINARSPQEIAKLILERLNQTAKN